MYNCIFYNMFELRKLTKYENIKRFFFEKYFQHFEINFEFVQFLILLSLAKNLQK